VSINRIIFDQTDPDDPANYYAFDDIVGALDPKQNEAQVIERFGVDGETVRLLATRAANSRAVFVRYLADRATALSAIEAYVDLIDGNPYELIQHGESFGYWKILRINPQPIRPAIMAGTLTTGAGVGLFLDVTLRSAFTPVP
jgi:hypothetical protein